LIQFPTFLPNRKELGRKLPGYVATALIILVTVLWTFWSVGEMYYEGWWGPWYNRLLYLIPGSVCLALTLIALAWPRLGGWVIILIGGAFTAWWWGPRLRAGAEFGQLLALFPVSGILVIIGVLFLLEARHRRLRSSDGWTPPRSWLRRNARYVVGVGLPLLVFIGWSVHWLPILLTRHDDGGRGARSIEGNGVALVWAPEGPGWNWKQPWGGYPSWDHIALYGAAPVGFDEKPGYEDQHATRDDMEASGLCRYLSADGTTLLPEPQDIWRMPTTDEIIRSLCSDGRNAACARREATRGAPLGRADCARRPDKETPLWAPDQPPIYYRSADEYDKDRAFYVSYNGAFSSHPKSWGNPRHGYRCVREP
jgi:hypothetical protein